jgi:hypothetical protein
MRDEIGHELLDRPDGRIWEFNWVPGFGERRHSNDSMAKYEGRAGLEEKNAKRIEETKDVDTSMSLNCRYPALMRISGVD